MAAVTIFSDFEVQENEFGQKIEILDPALRLQLILSPCANDILFSLFSIDKIALCDFLKLFRLL